MFSSDSEIEDLIEKGIPNSHESPSDFSRRIKSSEQKKRPSILLHKSHDNSQEASSVEQIFKDEEVQDKTKKSKIFEDYSIKTCVVVDKDIESKIKNASYSIYPRSLTDQDLNAHKLDLNKLVNFTYDEHELKSALMVLTKAYAQWASDPDCELFILWKQCVARYAWEPLRHSEFRGNSLMPSVMISTPPRALIKLIQDGKFFKKNTLEDTSDLLALKEYRAVNETYLYLQKYIITHDSSFVIFSPSKLDSCQQIDFKIESAKQKDCIKIRGLVSSMWSSHLLKKYDSKEYESAKLKTTEYFEFTPLKRWKVSGYCPQSVLHSMKSKQKSSSKRGPKSKKR